SLGEDSIRQKAIDIAGQVQIYIQAHPTMSPDEMTELSHIAVQPVGKTGYTLMFDRDRAVMVYHVNPEMIGFDLSQWADRLPAFWEIYKEGLTGKPAKGYYDWVDADGLIREKYMYIAPVEGTHYMLAATTYIDEFSYPANEISDKINAAAIETSDSVANMENLMRIVFIIITIVLMGFAGLLAWYLARQFSRPILELLQGAQRLGEGKLEHRVVVKTGDEIEKLASQFNTMAQALQESHTVLEQRVEERTRAEKRRSEQLRAINEVGQRITSLMNPDEVLPFIVNSLQKTFGYYSVSISLIERESGKLMVSAIAGKEETSGMASSREIVSGAAGQVMETGQPLVINDITEVPENTHATGSEMAVPIRLSKDMMGVLDIKSAEKGAFDELDIFTASTLADFVAIGIENAHLYRNVRDIATLEERNRLAREIHDTLAQGFVGVIRQLEVAKRMVDKDIEGANKHLDQAETLARYSLNEARRSVLSLRQSLVKHVSLPDAIRDEASRFSEINDIPVNVNISGQPVELKADDEESLLRVFQEAITNIGRHSNASMVDVDLSYNDGSINLSIHDNGAGFDTRMKKQGSFGIIDMKERVSLLKGQFKIESKPGSGTTIFVNIPV
ncbi:MAG: histidine kinase, partial [Dehalococcoidia bacterium]